MCVLHGFLSSTAQHSTAQHDYIHTCVGSYSPPLAVIHRCFFTFSSSLYLRVCVCVCVWACGTPMEDTDGGCGDTGYRYCAVYTPFLPYRHACKVDTRYTIHDTPSSCNSDRTLLLLPRIEKKGWTRREKHGLRFYTPPHTQQTANKTGKKVIDTLKNTPTNLPWISPPKTPIPPQYLSPRPPPTYGLKTPCLLLNASTLSS